MLQLATRGAAVIVPAEVGGLMAQPCVEDVFGSVSRAAERQSGGRLPDVEARPRGRIPSSIGDFEVLGQIGAGGMGVVYEVRDGRESPPIALKAMKAAGAERLMRFKGEFRYTASITHRNLVSLYELGVADGTWFFTMERVPGLTLDQDLAQRSPSSALRPEVIADRFAQVVEGLSALHAAGVQHLDLKPANVMVTPEGRVVVLDFGLASLSQGFTHEADLPVLGTVFYMSPEQALGDSTSSASDLYAVGAMLYEALVGHCPYEESSPKSIGMLYQKTTKTPLHPCELVSLDPAAEALADLAWRLLCIDPEERPSAAEVLATLRGDGDDLPSSSTPAPFIGREDELRRFRQILAERPKDRPAVLHVRGPSGTGKSRLLDQLVQELRQDEGNVVFASKCHEYETIPYKGVDGLVDQLVIYLRGMSIEQRSGLACDQVARAATMFPTILGAVPGLEEPSPLPSGAEMRQLAYSGLAMLLERVATERSLFLVLDDVQWGDAGAARILASLLCSNRSLPFVLLLSYRSDEAEQSAILHEIEELKQVRIDARFVEEQIDVGPLTSEAAQELARCLLEGASTEVAGALADEAERNPFFIEQLALHGAPQTDRPSLGALVRGRYEALDGLGRRLLRLAAVAGRPIDQRLLFDAAGVKDGRRELARLARTSLLRVDGLGATGKVVTYHDRIRREVIDALDAQTLRACHASLAECLLAGPSAQPHLVARHLHGAGYGAVGRTAR